MYCNTPDYRMLFERTDHGIVDDTCRTVVSSLRPAGVLRSEQVGQVGSPTAQHHQSPSNSTPKANFDTNRGMPQVCAFPEKYGANFVSNAEDRHVTRMSQAPPPPAASSTPLSSDSPAYCPTSPRDSPSQPLRTSRATSRRMKDQPNHSCQSPKLSDDRTDSVDRVSGTAAATSKSTSASSMPNIRAFEQAYMSLSDATRHLLLYAAQQLSKHSNDANHDPLSSAILDLRVFNEISLRLSASINERLQGKQAQTGFLNLQ